MEARFLNGEAPEFNPLFFSENEAPAEPRFHWKIPTSGEFTYQFRNLVSINIFIFRSLIMKNAPGSSGLPRRMTLYNQS